MLSHKKSLNILKKTNALLEGHFILSSGLHSSKYIQCAKLLSFPYLAEEICKSLASQIKKNYKKNRSNSCSSYGWNNYRLRNWQTA
jgi:orotate phosphoribosyltransferase